MPTFVLLTLTAISGVVPVQTLPGPEGARIASSQLSGSDAVANTQAAGELLRRLLPDRCDEFQFESLESIDGRDVFEIETCDGRLVIRGNTGVAMAMGLNWYLKHHCHCHVSWYGNQLNLPASLPAVIPKVRQTAWAKHRYFLNYCCFGYSLPWWDWPQWERLIDWMALNGVNLPLSVTGQEAVWQAVCLRMGMTPAEVQDFLAGPPFLPFQWMGCLDGWGGPLPANWIARHEALAQRILERQRQLGMTPVLQGFTGHVPAAIARRFPDAAMQTIRWIEWETHLLDPLDPLFARMAALFMEEQQKRFGTDHVYAADTFIEMVPPRGDLPYLSALAQAIDDGMRRYDPQAVWVLQGWAFMINQQYWTPPRIKTFLDAIDSEQMIILDLFCESNPVWSKTEAFYGKPWLWCNVQSFGRTVRLGGSLAANNDGLMSARRSAVAGELTGLGMVNEGLCYNPVVYDHLFEMAWRDEAVDLPRWIHAYARHRYGQANPHAQSAWDTLLMTVYANSQQARSVIELMPTLQSAQGSPYGTVQLAEAWQQLLMAGSDLRDIDTYRFDLVNVARQVLANHASTLHQRLVRAYDAADVEAFRAASKDYLELIRDLEELLATRSEFLLGCWLADARRWGDNDQEQARCLWNARRVLTLWGEGPAIDDYAGKQWAGMLSGYYLPRWQKFLEHAANSLERTEPIDTQQLDSQLRAWARTWSDDNAQHSTEPSGDSMAVASRLWEKYGIPLAQPDAVSLTTGKPASCAHALPAFPAHLANDGWSNNTEHFWATDVNAHTEPAWWCVDLQRVTRVGRVVVVGFYGDSRHYGFTVECSADGQQWNMVADRRDNQEPSTSAGYVCRFAPQAARYIRVTQTANSANSGRHLVEVMAYEQ